MGDPMRSPLLGCGVGASALACLLTTTTFKGAVVKAIRLGGDTDTRAAIVGGWAGITREIPQAWIDGVEDAGHLTYLDAQLFSFDPLPLRSSTQNG